VTAAGRQTRAAAAPARVLAARVLERVESDAAFADLTLEAESTRQQVAPRDIGLATELVYGTLRWQRYLDWILAPHSRRRLDTLDARVRILLRMTAYQLVFLGRVPPFAAVNDAVTLARSGARGAAEYTNAVLRALARRGARE
jgi:16S rRNA (cytosine967-C5)-methyltransferase